MAVTAARRGRGARTAHREASGQAPVAEVLAQARGMIAANERLDMARLSAELGVDRTTLFRWVGNRDQLLVEVVWSVVEPLLRDCVTAADGSGPAYLARVLGRWVAAAHRSAELRAVVARDPERALRLLAAPGGDLHRRLVEAVEKLLHSERASGCLPHPVALAELAEIVVRTVNSYLWTDLITGEPPNPVRAQVAVGLLLRPRSAEH
jgi:AcrR family transcriptional regulator